MNANKIRNYIKIDITKLKQAGNKPTQSKTGYSCIEENDHKLKKGSKMELHENVGDLFCWTIADMDKMLCKITWLKVS